MNQNHCYAHFNDLYKIWAAQKIELTKVKRHLRRNNVIFVLCVGGLLAIVNACQIEQTKVNKKLKKEIEDLKRARGE